VTLTIFALLFLLMAISNFSKPKGSAGRRRHLKLLRVRHREPPPARHQRQLRWLDESGRYVDSHKLHDGPLVQMAFIHLPTR